MRDIRTLRKVARLRLFFSVLGPMYPTGPATTLNLHPLRVDFALDTTTDPVGLEPAHACRVPTLLW